MYGRVIVAGIVGGLVIFLWGAIWHAVLPFSTAGLKTIPNEERVLAAMRETMSESGVYLFPGMDMSRDPSEAEWEAWSAKIQSGPSGLMSYVPSHGSVMGVGTLAVELASNVLAALCVAFVLARFAGSIVPRALAAALIGLAAWFSILASFRTWYGFSDAFVLGALGEQVIGWLLAGFAMAYVLARAERTARTHAAAAG
jgi:hypothetical protein